MTCPTESLYQLEFEVKSIARCERSEDASSNTVVSVQFLNHPEQTVCEIPANTSKQADGGTEAARSGVTAVGKGKTFTFAMRGGGGGGGSCGGGGPKPVRVAVRLYKVAGGECPRGGGRSELGSGELEIVPCVAPPATERHRPQPAYTTADEHTVPIKDGGGRCGGSSASRNAVAVLMVNARAWCVGPVTAVPLEPSAAPATGHAPSCPAHQRRGCDRSASRDRKRSVSREHKSDGGCFGAAQEQPVQEHAVQGQATQTPPQQRSCRRSCGITGGHCAAATPDAHQQRQPPQHTSADHGGRNGEQRTRKNQTIDKAAFQKQIAIEVEEFTSKLVNILSDMCPSMNPANNSGGA